MRRLPAGEAGVDTGQFLSIEIRALLRRHPVEDVKKAGWGCPIQIYHLIE
jgi:hypothetical protein